MIRAPMVTPKAAIGLGWALCGLQIVCNRNDGE